jgi:hypothetical protein
MKTIKRVTLILSLVVLMLVSMVSAEQYVQVDSSGQAIDQIIISSYSTPEFGKIYLLVDITISNHGYDNVYTNPGCFQVEINKVKYGYDAASYLNEIGGAYDIGGASKPMLDTVDLGDGGQISGYLVFQIPRDAPRYNLIYDPGYPPMKVRYNYTEGT